MIPRDYETAAVTAETAQGVRSLITLAAVHSLEW